jgi:hypothetical protein
LHGVFVQSYAISQNNSVSMDFSISLPFIHRPDDGIWTFQNKPLSNGFIVIVPTLGYPPTPVQHMVSIRSGTAEYPKGTVFRLENSDMSLFRKMDTIPFDPSLRDQDHSSCSCSH